MVLTEVEVRRAALYAVRSALDFSDFGKQNENAKMILCMEAAIGKYWEYMNLQPNYKPSYHPWIEAIERKLEETKKGVYGNPFDMLGLYSANSVMEDALRDF